MFRRGGIDQTRHKRCRRAGRDMENTSPKFGGWGLCATCGREREVKATENTKWMVTEKKRNPAKRGVGKKNKNSVMMVLGKIDPGAHPRRL